ncbi:MAG: chemotaxis protein CheW [Gemmatimonadaceae bacterium]
MTQLSTLDQDINATDANQYLTFILADEHYGLEILKVQEIKGVSTITRMPNTPPHVRGVTNLRGVVVPIVDLRARFGFPERPDDRFSVFVIANIGSRVVGLVVDSVEDVIDLPPEANQPTPELTVALGGAYVRGLAKHNDQLIALLDIDKIVHADLALLEQS